MECPDTLHFRGNEVTKYMETVYNKDERPHYPGIMDSSHPASKLHSSRRKFIGVV